MRLIGSYHSPDNGRLLKYETDSFYEVYESDSKESQKILCMGDSFTNGGNLDRKWEESYPFHLSKIFKPSKKFEIYNMGLCEDTTLGVHDRLVNYLSEYKSSKGIPKYVVLLVGSADGLHLKAEQRGDMVRWINPEKETSAMTKSWFYDLRIYKMYRHIVFAYDRWKILDLAEQKKVSMSWDFSKQYETAIKEGKYKEANIVLNKGLDFIDEKIPYENRLTTQEIVFRDSIEPIVESVVNANLLNNRYDKALEGLLLVAKRNPNVWDTYTMRLLVFQTFRKQMKYSADDIIELVRMDKDVASRSDVETFVKNLKVISENESEINKHREVIWEKIMDLSKKYNFQVIVQNYPSDYRSVNDFVKKISDKYNLPFVDNRSVFKELIEKGGREKYLRGDDHCTDLGYSIIAKNVSKVIQSLEK